MLGESLSVFRMISELRANFLKHSQKSHFLLQWPCMTLSTTVQHHEIRLKLKCLQGFNYSLRHFTIALGTILPYGSDSKCLSKYRENQIQVHKRYWKYVSKWALKFFFSQCWSMFLSLIAKLLFLKCFCKWKIEQF